MVSTHISDREENYHGGFQKGSDLEHVKKRSTHVKSFSVKTA